MAEGGSDGGHNAPRVHLKKTRRMRTLEKEMDMKCSLGEKRNETDLGNTLTKRFPGMRREQRVVVEKFREIKHRWPDGGVMTHSVDKGRGWATSVTTKPFIYKTGLGDQRNKNIESSRTGIRGESKNYKIPISGSTEKGRDIGESCGVTRAGSHPLNSKVSQGIPQSVCQKSKSERVSSISPRAQLSFSILNAWSENKDSEDLLLQISKNIAAVEKLLLSDNIPDKWYFCLVKVFRTIVECRVQPIRIKNVLRVVSASHFLTHMLTNYMDTKQTQGMAWTDAEEFLKSVLIIVQHIAKRLPDRAQFCRPVVKCLQEMVEHITPLSDNVELHRLMDSISVSVKENQNSWTIRQAGKNVYRPCLDSETPPEDFRDLPVIPTAFDLSSDVEPFVRAIIPKGCYRNQQHYLDVLFRLTREDFIRPLRKGIQEYRDRNQNKHFKSSDIRLYNDVHFVGMTHINGIDHVVQFDVSNMRHVKWDHAKRLLNGNLVCLSNDNFQSTFIFATISFRNTNLLKQGIVNVVCESGLNVVLKASPTDVFVMAETMAYYEAVYPILKCLQVMNTDLPLKRYLMFCEKKLQPPVHLRENYIYDISCLMKHCRPTEVDILSTLSWPTAENMCLNPLQRDAIILALTKEIALIQGPPGTGKTYVGLKIMQVLLKNLCPISIYYIRKDNPILVICYTNHALDQFLEGIISFCPDGIVRVGGKSSSDKLEAFNLKNLKKNRRQISRAQRLNIERVRNKVTVCSKQVESLKKELDSLTTDVLSEEKLSSFMNIRHYHSLVTTPHTVRKSKIHQWLNAPNESLLQALPGIIKLHMTKLVIKCLKFIPFKDHGINLDKGRLFVDERVQVYGQWLLEYQATLKNTLEASQTSRSVDTKRLSYIYQRSFRASILDDNEILRVIPAKDFVTIKRSFGKKSANFEVPFIDRTIEAWVLGLHNDCGRQLHDVEKLSRFIQKLRNSDHSDDDNFDDKEESKRVINERQFYEEEEEEAEYFNATLRVTTEGSYLLKKAMSLGVIENVKDAPQARYEDDNNGFQTVSHSKPLTFSQVERYLSDKKRPAMGKEKEDAILDVWTLGLQDRFSLYKIWINRYKEQIVHKLGQLIEEYSRLKQELTDARMGEDIEILRRVKVIGMTTTGAAKRQALLDAVGCRIIIVEEAAEVLEAHIVTALNKNCQHLILIGDHKQLRPSTTVYEHAKNFNLDVSLFERLVNNDIPHVTLSEQHRMRESISSVMRHIYPNLKDHESVKLYENIRGVSKNIFFIQHNQKEECIKDTMSKSNPFEAEYLIRLCMYLLMQGYQATQITILATYVGQVLTLKKEMKKQSLNHDVRITSVDNFQGEENDIILLSLVRSNEQNVAGFLKVDNRVCVALSRARKGLFAIGNLELLASQSNLWEKIKNTAELEGITGECLPIFCPNHPDDKKMIRVPADFDCCPLGGCLKTCDFRLDCGHMCHLTCHGYDSEHYNVKCQSPCNKTCPSKHPCKKLCSDDCGKCPVRVSKRIIACGHTNMFMCSQIPKDTDCFSPCNKDLSCGHQCSGRCGKCKENGHHKACTVPVTYMWPCSHECEVPCYFRPEEYPCPKPCSQILQCGHTCPGKCSDCVGGRAHAVCAQKCNELLH